MARGNAWLLVPPLTQLPASQFGQQANPAVYSVHSGSRRTVEVTNQKISLGGDLWHAGGWL